MEDSTRRIAIDGHGRKPETPKPTPTLVSGTRGEGQKPSTPKPAPKPAAGQKGG
jgi:hypothetical protein